MAAPAAFLASRRTEILLLPEYTAYQTALTNYGNAAPADQGRYWAVLFDDAPVAKSAAYRLRAAIRETVRAAQDGTVSPLDLEGACSSLAAEYVTDIPKPTSAAEDQALIQGLLLEDAVT